MPDFSFRLHTPFETVERETKELIKVFGKNPVPWFSIYPPVANTSETILRLNTWGPPFFEIGVRRDLDGKCFLHRLRTTKYEVTFPEDLTQLQISHFEFSKPIGEYRPFQSPQSTFKSIFLISDHAFERFGNAPKSKWPSYGDGIDFPGMAILTTILRGKLNYQGRFSMERWIKGTSGFVQLDEIFRRFNRIINFHLEALQKPLPKSVQANNPASIQQEMSSRGYFLVKNT